MLDKYLKNNNVVKVVALIIGILLWVVVHMESDTPATQSANAELKEQYYKNVSVTAKFDEEQYTLKSITPADVTVQVQWRENTFRKLNVSNMSVEADLTGMTEGTHTVQLRVKGVTGASSSEAIPQTVRVVLEKIHTKQVPVVITTTGTPAEGFKAGEPVVKPNRVNVEVPDSLLDQLDSARAEINIADVNSTVTKQVKLVAVDKNGKQLDLQVSPTIVDVEIPITSPFKQMPLQIKLVGEPAPGYAVASYEQDPAMITVYGPQNVLDAMEFYEGPQIDLTDLTSTMKKKIDVPAKTGVLKVEPAKVEVNVEIVASTTKEFDIPIKLIGTNAGYNSQLAADTTSIHAILEGAPNVLAALNAEDVQAVVDISNLAPGEHVVPVTINLPMFVKKPTQAYTAKVLVTALSGTKTDNGGGVSPVIGTAPPSSGAGASNEAGATPSPTPNSGSEG
ncbi:YbbR-like domain-containing protein [Gorillibacterium massiliense]|uniref:CdaR family protein n=1 Tax=Gorillibacterium massiliense TaxID=1280390 RepID=UPI0004AEA368|nr:CdaR family protein [Gorillibacterium massiliense]